jgi:carbon monoxide dehydrogenase subunit G
VKLEQSFEVAAPVEEVWAALIDVQRVAPCLPGAEITEAGDDGVYHGTFTVRLGPTTASYRGKLELQSLDEAARVATMKASGSDKRGQGGANATMVSRMTSLSAGGTRVEVETDFTITGRLARFGRGGMIQDVSNRLLGDFASCLQASLTAAEPEAGGAPAGGGATADAGTPAGSSEPEPESPAGAAPAAAPRAQPAAAPRARPAPAKPINGVRLMLSVLWKRLARLLGRG